MTGLKNNLNDTFLKLLVGDWHIDVNYGIQEFNKYMEKIELIQNGATIFDMFNEQKEKSKRLCVVSASGAIKDVSSISEITEDSILELSFSGVMRDEDGLCSMGINSFNEQLYNAYGNPNVKGILINLNSGGGQSSSGYNLQQAIADKNKPVVVRSSILASAALNGALPATEIIAASDAAQIGSIGSYISLDLKAIKEYKETILDIYSKVSPDKNAAFRDAIEGNYDKLTDYVTENAKMFQDKVRQYLKLDQSKMLSTLSGGTFMAQDAKERGLVHSVGSRQFAIKRIFSHIKYS